MTGRTFAAYWIAPVTHASDETNGKTLCGLPISHPKWDCGGSAYEPDELGVGCTRCQAALDKIIKESQP